jgi:protein-tyrosine-phosphatase
MKSILFVCSANQCRSPMAEVLFENLVRERGEEDEWRVESAGVWAYGGAPATGNARLAMEERGLSLERHRSQQAENELLSQFDLIVVMTREHRETLLAQMPALDGRVHLLRELDGGTGDFADPVGGDLTVYKQAASEIETILRQGFPHLDQLLASE